MNFNTERYQRQLILEGFGLEAQEKLSNAKVLIIGAGGLGCPILQYLVAAGVGNIGICDDDTITLSNLNRQVLYGQDDIGKYKVEVAVAKMIALNNQIQIKAFNERWSQSLSVEYFPEYDIIVDATDNFATRYLINDACVLFNKPLVFGAVSKYEGQIAIFNVANDGVSTNYRDLFPDPPKNNEVQSCSEAGVLGVLPGMIGVMQAAEVIKLITGIGKPLINQLQIYNALNQSMYTTQLFSNQHAVNNVPDRVESYLQINYEHLCEAEPVTNSGISEIAIEDWILNREAFLLVDVREVNELPSIANLNPLIYPLSTIKEKMNELINKPIVFICQSGARSKKVAAMFHHSDQSVYSLKGGVNELMKKKIIQ